jgi:tyrosine-protein kinase Etk/Wzc
MNKNFDDIFNQEQQSDSFDLKKLIVRYLQFWHWFVVSVVVAIALTWVVNKVSSPAYRGKTTVLIQDDKRGSMNQNSLISNLDLFGTQKNLHNEIGILNSYSINKKTIEDLHLYISYLKDTKYRNKKDVYGNTPFMVVADTSHFQALDIDVAIQVTSNSEFEVSYECEESTVYLYKYSSDEINLITANNTCNQTYKVKAGEEFKTDFFSFRIFPIKEISTSDFQSTYYIRFIETAKVTESFMNRLQIDPINKESSIVQISLEDRIPKRALDYLNRLAQNYINLGLDEKTLIASKTIEFIDEQLMGITDTLEMIEQNLEFFRTANKITDLSFQGQTIFHKVQTLEYEKSMEQMKVGYYTYLLSYVQSDSTGADLVAPSVIGIEDPLLNKLIIDLSQFYATREQLKMTTSGINPYMTELDKKIETTKRIIIENVHNILSNAKFTLQEKNKQLQQVQAELQSLPKTERELIGIQRKFTVNDQIYTYLLEKRAEAAIARASSISDHKIIDKARIERQTKPKKMQNYAIAFLLALLIPMVVIFVIDQIKNTILDVSEVEGLTNLPIIGSVVHTKEKSITPQALAGNVVESFRAIRTNLEFFVPESKNRNIAVTSINPSEGKSFCSFHLAYVFALSGKKTLLMGTDLRKPDLGAFFNIKTEKGLSTFLSKKDKWEDILFPVQSVENMFFIPAGPVPPNPAELLSPNLLTSVFENTKEFDVVVFDTSPIGLFSDAAYVLKQCDINLFVTRFHISKKSDFKFLNQAVDKLHVNNPAIICNDLKQKRSKYYYNYYYGAK